MKKKSLGRGENVLRFGEKYDLPDNSKSHVLLQPQSLDMGFGRSTSLFVPGFAYDYDTDYARLQKSHNQRETFQSLRKQMDHLEKAQYQAKEQDQKQAQEQNRLDLAQKLLVIKSEQ